MLAFLKKFFRRTETNRHNRRALQGRIRRVLGLSLKLGRPIFEPDSTTSWIVYAAAGGGKTTCVAVPAVQALLADKLRAIVINDVKSGEIAFQIAEMCRRHGRNFAAIDDSFVMGADYAYRISVNPLDNLVAAFEAKSPTLLIEIENACHTFIKEPDGGDEKNLYFRQVPREIIELAILILLTHNARLCTPGGIAAFLGDPDVWNPAVDIEAEEGEALTRSRAKQVKELRENDPEHYSQHYLAALSALRIFQVGGAMHEAGRDPDITHAQLLAENYIVCLVQNQKNASRLSTYYGLHFNAFLSAQLSDEIDCGRTDIILDEAANTPAKDLIEKVTIFRAHQLRVIYIAQSRTDLQRQNGEKLIATLEDNCNKQYLKFSNFEEAERVSRAMGEVDNVNFTLSESTDKLDLSRTHQTGRERMFPADALMALPSDEQILHISGVGFVHCKKIRQNQIAPTCFDLAVNPLEGGRLEPDPLVTLPTEPGGNQ